MSACYNATACIFPIMHKRCHGSQSSDEISLVEQGTQICVEHIERQSCVRGYSFRDGLQVRDEPGRKTTYVW